jgi:hypothetical protein
MPYVNRTGKIARFKTGYLQREIILHQAKVTNGTDASIHSDNLGFLVGRIVTVTKDAQGIYTVTMPTDTTDANVITGSNKYIIAQSDNSMRGTPEDCIPTDRYDSRYDGIVKNTTGTDTKAVAVYKIVNTDDIELIEL